MRSMHAVYCTNDGIRSKTNRIRTIIQPWASVSIGNHAIALSVGWPHSIQKAL